jgi:uncharacterized protein YfbU (UPF0304 family)
MTLTKIERLTLMNQYRILAKLYPGEASGYSRFADALEHGFTHEYDDFLTGLDEEMPGEQCAFVYRVLSMYEALHSSWHRVSDKGGISADRITYQGFDGNSEGQFMTYSRFIVEQRGLFDYIGIKDHNSHLPSIVRYERMLEAWGRFDESHDLTIEQMQAILAS